MATHKTDLEYKILLAVDGSEHALAATQLTRDLPLSSGSRIIVVAAIVPRDASSHAALEAVLKHAQELFGSKGLQVETQLLVGYPAEEIAKCADQIKPDLIILGARGLRSTFGILLGGVAQQVLEYAQYPVLVVRAPYSGIHKLLLITDGSAHSHKAAEFVQSFPFRAETEIRVMHVLPPLPSPSLIARSWPIGSEVIPAPPSYEAERMITQQAEEDEKAGKVLLDRAVGELRNAGISASGVLTRGDAATEILAYIKENRIDLVVAGSRGLSRMKGFLLGSLSRKLVHYAGCSVLIVKSAINPS